MEGKGEFLRFDGVEIDLAGHRLRRDGVEQPLEPKAFAVLLLLVAQPGRAFERDQILDAVWGHTHITPGTLNRIITLLRHALGETADAPRYLHTVHGVGYRFDADVVRSNGDAEPGSVPAPPPVAAAVASVAPVVEATRSDDRDPRPTPAPTSAAPGTGKPWLFLVLFGLAVLAAALTWQWNRSEVKAPVAVTPAPAAIATESGATPKVTPTLITAAPVLAVLPLRPLGEDARSADFADGLSEELTNLLARIEGLRVTSLTSSFQFRESDTALPEIAHRLGATHLLEGSVRQEGTRLRIALRLVDAARGQAMWSETYDREFRDIFAVQDSIARAVGETLRLELGLVSASTYRDEDPELYRRYLVARRNFESVSRLGNPAVPPAAEALRDLVREHPEYPRAWGGLATMLWQFSTVPRQGREALRAEAEAAAATALRLDPEQPDALAVLAGQSCREQRWAECLDGSRRAVQNAPSDSLWRTWLAARLAATGRVQDALREQQSAVQMDPLGNVPQQFLGRLLDTLGRHDEALPHLRLAGLPAQTATYFNAIWRRDYVEAKRLAELLGPEVPWRSSQLAAAEALSDPTKLPQLLAAIEHSERNLLPEDLREPYDFMRFVLPPAHRDYPRDIEALNAVQRAGYASYQWIFWMPGERALRQSPAFQKYLRDSGLLAYWREHGWPDLCRSDGGEGVVCD